MQIDTHVYGSFDGYRTLSHSAGVTQSECEELEELGFGQPPSSDDLLSLSERPCILGRPLKSGRIAITRAFPGRRDDVGRPTIMLATLIMKSEQFHGLRSDLRHLIENNEIWKPSLFSAGSTVSISEVRHSSDRPENDVWHAADLWIDLVGRRDELIVLPNEVRSEQAILDLVGRLSPDDAEQIRWGIWLLSASARADICTMAPYAAGSLRRKIIRTPLEHPWRHEAMSFFFSNHTSNDGYLPSRIVMAAAGANPLPGTPETAVLQEQPRRQGGRLFILAFGACAALVVAAVVLFVFLKLSDEVSDVGDVQVASQADDEDPVADTIPVQQTQSSLSSNQNAVTPVSPVSSAVPATPPDPVTPDSPDRNEGAGDKSEQEPTKTDKPIQDPDKTASGDGATTKEPDPNSNRNLNRGVEIAKIQGDLERVRENKADLKPPHQIGRFQEVDWQEYIVEIKQISDQVEFIDSNPYADSYRDQIDTLRSELDDQTRDAGKWLVLIEKLELLEKVCLIPESWKYPDILENRMKMVREDMSEMNSDPLLDDLGVNLNEIGHRIESASQEGYVLIGFLLVLNQDEYRANINGSTESWFIWDEANWIVLDQSSDGKDPIIVERTALPQGLQELDWRKRIILPVFDRRVTQDHEADSNDSKGAVGIEVPKASEPCDWKPKISKQPDLGEPLRKLAAFIVDLKHKQNEGRDQIVMNRPGKQTPIMVPVDPNRRFRGTPKFKDANRFAGYLIEITSRKSPVTFENARKAADKISSGLKKIFPAAILDAPILSDNSLGLNIKSSCFQANKTDHLIKNIDLLSRHISDYESQVRAAVMEATRSDQRHDVFDILDPKNPPESSTWDTLIETIENWKQSLEKWNRDTQIKSAHRIVYNDLAGDLPFLKAPGGQLPLWVFNEEITWNDVCQLHDRRQDMVLDGDNRAMGRVLKGWVQHLRAMDDSSGK